MATALRLQRFLRATAACALAWSAAGGAWAQAASAPAGGQGMAAPGMAGSGMAASGPMHGGGMDMHGAMMQGAQAMQQMKPTGDADRDFATMMRAHHQQAVEMSQAYLKQAKSPELKKMAQKIIRDQQREVGQFDKWLQAHK